MWGIPVPARVPVGGLGWGRVLLSGAGVPADALGKLGDRYFDIATGRWYLKRWVGNFSGPDSMVVPTIPIIGANNWTFEVVIWLDPVNADWGNVMCANAYGPGSTMVRAMANGQLAVDYYGKQGVYTGTILKANWYKATFSGTYDGTTLYDSCVIKGVGSWNSTQVDSARATGNGLKFGGVFGGSQFIGRMCNIKAIGSGYALNIPMDDGAGVAVKDVSGGNYPGTVADGSPTTFWLQTWVPMDLL